MDGFLSSTLSLDDNDDDDDDDDDHVHVSNPKIRCVSCLTWSLAV